jgi:hypothetical protein
MNAQIDLGYGSQFTLGHSVSLDITDGSGVTITVERRGEHMAVLHDGEIVWASYNHLADEYKKTASKGIDWSKR